MWRSFCSSVLVSLGLLLGACGGDGSASSRHDDDASEATASAPDAAADASPQPDAAEDASLVSHDASSADDDAMLGSGDAQATDAGADATPMATEPALADLLEHYRSWPTRQSAPQSISSQIWALCRLPSLPEQRFADSEHGKGLLLLDYLNASAKQGADAKATRFALGAAIVKEKLMAEAAGQLAVVARGLMIKRAPGFDPAHGDWQFGYWEPSTGLSSGPASQDYCGGCHASAETDFVFLDQSWRQP